jgi:hypothetical protein
MYLSYSGFKKYRECPRQYWHSYVNKTKVPTPENRVNMLYGSCIGIIVEHFYRDKMWKLPDPAKEMLSRVSSVVAETMRNEIKGGGIFNWKDPKLKKNGPHSLDQVIQEIREAIPNSLAIIRKFKLLGTDAAAEVKLDSEISGHMLGGRCDFRMRRLHPLGDLIILDGKGSRHRDKYVDIEQLHWYSMLHRRKTGSLPDQVAFVFWRFPPDEAVDWSVPTRDAVDELQETVIRTIEEIEQRKRLPIAAQAFPARAKKGACGFCPFVFACPEGQVMTSENRPQISPASGVEDVAIDE